MFVVLFVVRILLVVGIVSLSTLIPAKTITGVENYDKTYYLEEYGGDLDSNLSIFPDDILNLKNSEFSSSFQTNFFDSDGYILLITKYEKHDFEHNVPYRDSALRRMLLLRTGCKKRSGKTSRTHPSCNPDH